MQNGYNQKILHVDLTNKIFFVEKPSIEFYKKYMGGGALNTYYLLNEIPAGADPLGPDNVLAVSISVITGAPIPGLSRVNINAKSPLTGCIGDSQAGGFFPVEMKYAGFDAIIVKGIADRPVYLWICDGEYELRDASHLWGKDTGTVEDMIHEELGDNKVEIAQAGIAAENGVRYAAVINMCNRANGRTGMGTVMASKNLKAIAVRGKEGRRKFSYANRSAFMDLLKEGNRKIKNGELETLGKYGTSRYVGIANSLGRLPTSNFNSGYFDKTDQIDGVRMYDEMLKGAKENNQDREGRDTCFGCTIHCKRVVEYESDKFTVDPRYGGPEYETVAMMGSDCGIDDLPTILKANELCNRYGLDTISCGATIAWAMECFEQGKLTLEDTHGIELTKGNGTALLEMIELIAHKEGFGKVLGLGSQKASDIIGKGTNENLVVGHGQEFPAHLPRTKVSLSVIYATNPFGADHQSSAHDPVYERENPNTETDIPPYLQELNLTTPTGLRTLDEKKVEFARVTQDYYSFMDSICICQFVFGLNGPIYSPKEVVKIIQSITGWDDINIEDLLLVGERRVNMMRMFNAREGIDKTQDTLPKKIFKPLVGGPSDGFVIDLETFEKALNEYYSQRGWDVNSGNPTSENLEKLGLAWTENV
ncbi:MAG: aldehyde ferredoxin oxidoreductase family protein, partial [Chloroflexota bacterium]|jgi:aldehyde:ferredoxin oxidoreductase|nr:aldehyde ferredoxin oxidoreductase family protein [Chloroflexota bacterium]